LYEQDPISKIAPFVYATDVSVNGTYLKKKNAECAGSQGRGILIGCNSTFLLDHGDELQISETVRLVFSSAKLIVQEQFTPTQEKEKAIFAQDYLITDRLLGEGGYGKVLIGIDQASQRQLACKMIKLDHLYNRPHAPNLRLPTGPRDKKASSGRISSKISVIRTLSASKRSFGAITQSTFSKSSSLVAISFHSLSTKVAGWTMLKQWSLFARC
jgi:hypothetical protein